MKDNFDLAIAIHKPGEELQKALEKVNVQKTEDGTYFFPYDSEKESDYDDIADVGADDLDATLTLGLYHSSDNNFYPSDVLTEALANQGGVDANSISVDFLDSIDPNDYDEEIKTEVERIQKEYYAADAMKKQRIEEQKKVTQNDKKPENTVSSNEKENSESKNQESTDSETKHDDKSSNSESEDSNELPPEKQGPENSDDFLGDSESKLYEEAQTDPLLSMAADRFKNECTTQIPIFDPYTTEQIRPQLVESHTNISRAQDKTIYAIYQKLQKKRDAFEREFDDKFKENEEEHEHTIKIISDNESEQIKVAKEKNKKKYDQDKKRFIQEQQSLLEVKFDNEHKAEYDKKLRDEINDIQLKAQEKREQEQNNYDEFRAEQEDEYLKSRLEKVDISDEMKDFEKEAAKEINHINEAAQNFVDQVAVVTKANDAERKQAIEKYKQAQASLDTYKETFDARVAEGIEKGVNDRMHKMSEKLQNADKLNNEQRQEINDMSQKFADEKQQTARKHADELDARDKKWRQELEDATKAGDKKYQTERAAHEADIHQKDNEIKQLKEKYNAEKDNSKKLENLVRDLQMQSFQNHTGVNNSNYMQNPQFQQSQVVQPNMQAQTDEKAVSREQKHVEKSKSKMGIGTKIALGIMAVATVGSVGFGTYVLGATNEKNVNANSESQTASVVTNNSVSTSKAQSQQPTQYKKGDTWTYSPTPNEKYTVTMDSPTQGHYKDAQGITKTIVVAGNNTQTNN